MSRTASLPRRRFCRNRDRAVVAGVCAGIADYFGFNLIATRFVAVVSLLVAMPVTLIAYFATVLLVPATPGARTWVADYTESRRRNRPEPRPTIEDVRRRFRSLDDRLARLERYVTSSRFQLDQELRKL